VQIPWKAQIKQHSKTTHTNYWSFKASSSNHNTMPIRMPRIDAKIKSNEDWQPKTIHRKFENQTHSYANLKNTQKPKFTPNKQNLNYHPKLKFEKMSNTPNIKTKIPTSTRQASTATTPTPNTKPNPHENFHQPIK